MMVTQHDDSALLDLLQYLLVHSALAAEKEEKHLTKRSRRTGLPTASLHQHELADPS